jgi:hypothetical protein
MSTKSTVVAVLLLALMVLAVIAATAAAASPHPTYTCTKTKKKGGSEVRTSVPETAVPSLTNAGFACVVEDSDDEGTDTGTGTGETTDEGSGDDSSPENGPGHSANAHSSSVVTPAPESRSIYCSTTGLVERPNDDQAGVALNLPDSQGALLVAKGLATPGIYYEGIGVSCDVLPGFTYSGVWVDHVGDVVPGVAVYPYYVPGPS